MELSQMNTDADCQQKREQIKTQNRLSKQWCPITTSALTLCDVYNQKHSIYQRFIGRQHLKQRRVASTSLSMQSLGFVGFEAQISRSVNLFKSIKSFTSHSGYINAIPVTNIKKILHSASPQSTSLKMCQTKKMLETRCSIPACIIFI